MDSQLTKAAHTHGGNTILSLKLGECGGVMSTKIRILNFGGKKRPWDAINVDELDNSHVGRMFDYGITIDDVRFSFPDEFRYGGFRPNMYIQKHV